MVLPPSIVSPAAALPQEAEPSQRDPSSPEPESPAPRPEDELFRECLQSHLQKIEALGEPYRDFVQSAFRGNLVSSMSHTVRDLMRQAEALAAQSTTTD